VKKWIKSFLLRLYYKMEAIAEADLPRFANNPKNLEIERPRRLFETHRITIGDDVSIGPGAMLAPQVSYPSRVMRHPNVKHAAQRFDPKIVIGNRVTSTGLLTIAAMQEVTIEDDVMFALNVLISDGMHGFENAYEPYKNQKMWKIAPVLVKRGCWIGQNVVIMPGITIGEMSIIGANSVVTKSIPDRCIAVGAPARVVKNWDEANRCWVSV
jgi:acetyltransferase-like isoleucine patch superfamily enzyme